MRFILVLALLLVFAACSDSASPVEPEATKPVAGTASVQLSGVYTETFQGKTQFLDHSEPRHSILVILKDKQKIHLWVPPAALKADTFALTEGVLPQYTLSAQDRVSAAYWRDAFNGENSWSAKGEGWGVFTKVTDTVVEGKVTFRTSRYRGDPPFLTVEAEFKAPRCTIEARNCPL